MTLQERNKGIEKFVEHEIYANQTSLIEDALSKKFFSIDDIENIYRPFDGKLIKPSVCTRCESDFPFLDSETGECEDCFEETQTPQEIYEWWVVSPWLKNRLLIEGQPVLCNVYGVWWGRCTTGQAIMMDYVIQKVYDDVMGYTE